MKRAPSLLAALVTLAATPALAGSPATPTPAAPVAQAPKPIAPAGTDWTGPYGGLQLGYGDADTNLPNTDGDGVVGGIFAGYDYDFGNFVLGGSVDYDWTDIDLGTVASIDNVFRAKLRGGYEIGQGLIYGTGGYAYADTDTLGSDDGWFIGAGYEHMVTQRFSVGGEVLYHEFDNFNGSGADVEATTVQVRGAIRF